MTKRPFYPAVDPEKLREQRIQRTQLKRAQRKAVKEFQAQKSTDKPEEDDINDSHSHRATSQKRHISEKSKATKGAKLARFAAAKRAHIESVRAKEEAAQQKAQEQRERAERLQKSQEVRESQRQRLRQRTKSGQIKLGNMSSVLLERLQKQSAQT